MRKKKKPELKKRRNMYVVVSRFSTSQKNRFL